MSNETHAKQVSQLLKLKIDLKNALTDKDKFLLRRQVSILTNKIIKETPTLSIPDTDNVERIQRIVSNPYDRTTHNRNLAISKFAYAHWIFDDANFLWQNTAKTTAVTADADPVRVVQDRIGSNDLVAVSDDARFEFKTSQLNGNNICRADGTDDYMVSGAFSGLSAQPYYVIGIFEYISASAAEILTNGLDASHDAIGILPETSKWAMSANSPVLKTAGAIDNDPHAFKCYFNGSSSSLTVDDETVTGNVGTNHISTGIRCGSRYNGNQWANVDYLELMVVKSTISIADLALIFNYLRTRAGV